MEKLFKSKLAFIVFVILFTSCLSFFYKDSVSIALLAGSIGGLIGFVFAQWYWIEKMKDIQHLLDARMASPEQKELLKRKEDQLKEMSDSNTKLVIRISELQKEIELQQESYHNLTIEKMNVFGLHQQQKEKNEKACILIKEILSRPWLNVSTIKKELNQVAIQLISENQ